ncbi:hypothetical protein N0V91_005983 [Didymella pomorum]|uniref:Uncharacterized protein n=1 Tax=Didymella pomorum TaxID=749634 RepID=A0A9W8ZDR3_9PLEO|nr:hypothetical protein N0V91_005983 [Didymella pomorum]
MLPLPERCPNRPRATGRRGDGFSGGFSTNQFLLSSRGKVSEPASWQANERAVFAIQDFSTVTSLFPAFANASQPNTTTQDDFLVELPDLGNFTLHNTIRLPYAKNVTVTDDDATLTPSTSVRGLAG